MVYVNQFISLNLVLKLDFAKYKIFNHQYFEKKFLCVRLGILKIMRDTV